MNIKIIIFSLLILVPLNSSFAQKDEDRKKFKEEIGNLMKQKLVDSLGFDELTADKFVNLYNTKNVEIRALGKEKRKVMESIEENPAAPDVGSKIDKISELESAITEKRKTFLKDLETFLTPQQIANTLVLRKQIGKEIKKEFNKHKKKY